ncbi:MAG: hypothetical protein AMS24_01855 [Chlamydiae bacterium SM23_39]|nr:MAG: hypothetical protein AMS24_01855 [Chlamydiae bacterium SM23_39]
MEEILKNYVSNANSNIFVLRNLPEVVKGALFSRYSRSSLGLRELLLKEFINDKDLELKKEYANVKRAKDFYDRILDGYGDDSIAELGGAHLAMENISMIAAKVIEDCRIGGSPLEKSTRYIYFDKKIDGEYLFYKELVLMTSAYRNIYLDTCNLLFDTYSRLISPLTELIRKKFPKEYDVSKEAYASALKAKVLDCLRGILPASTYTNMGIFGNGRFFDYLIRKLNSSNLTEIQDIGKKAFLELSKEIPSFIRRADPSSKYFKSYYLYVEQMRQSLKMLYKADIRLDDFLSKPKVSLIDYDVNSVYKIAAALLFENSDKSFKELEEYCKTLPKKELEKILEVASIFRKNRRDKSPRALELSYFIFEIIADFGVYRDLQRHRILTQERQFLTCNYGYFIPEEIKNTKMEKDYRYAMEKAKEAYDLMSEEFPEEAQYVVPFAYNMRWFFSLNLRELQWFCELRSSPAGHPTYRFIAQDMAKIVSSKIPEFKRFFNFVDYDGYKLGRMKQEVKRVKKKIDV